MKKIVSPYDATPKGLQKVIVSGVKLQYRIEIISQTGQVIETEEIDNPFGLLTINIRNFTPGNYLLKFNNTVIKFTKM